MTLLKYFENSIVPTSKTEEETEEKKVKASNSIPIKDFSDLINIRVNNCFVNAKKEYLQEIQNLWAEYISNLKENNILNILIDSSITAASDKVVIITNNSEGTANLINEQLAIITNQFNQRFNKKYNFIAISSERWKAERQKYINNVKNKVNYEFIEEPETDTLKKESESSNIEEIALNIFDSDKIEIE